MGAGKYLNVEALKEQEAWRLFEEKAINEVKDPAFLSIGKEVAKRCKGLPVLIVTIAASLSSRPSLPAWKNALNQLKKMNNTDMHEIVNSAMEFISYKHLEKTHKQLFLLCGLMGSRVTITDLLKISLGWDLFGEDAMTVEDARNKLYNLIFDLRASCLLLNGNNENMIEMHNVVRGVAISIARKDLSMFSAGDNDTELNGWPGDDLLKGSTAIVFHRSQNYLQPLPEQLDCPLLQLFIVKGYVQDLSLTISDVFFERTRKLKVLGMSGLSISALPSSLRYLENLQTLRLDFCYGLEDISNVGDLKKLKVLSFVSSSIKELPRGVGQLSELRIFDLSYCSKLKVIPAGLIASLSQLEELYMHMSFDRWEAEECLSSSERRNASLAELKCLPNLCSLKIEVPDAKLLSEDLNFEKLEQYRIIARDMSVRDAKMRLDYKGISKRIGLQLGNTSINHLQHGVKRLLKRAESVCLRELKGINSIIHELDRDGFPDLKHLEIQTNSEIQFIVNAETKEHRAFPALKSLSLINLLKLEKICNGRLMEESFCNLTSLTVEKCDNLKHLLTSSITMGLLQIQRLTVKNCAMMKDIVANEEGETTIDAIIFPQLSYLCLEYLPSLITFCSSGSSILCQSAISDVTTMSKGVGKMESNENLHSVKQTLFDEKVNFPSLEELMIKNLDNIQSIWHSRLNEDSFCKLASITVRGCVNLLKIFPSTMLSKIQSLKRLEILYCGALEKVFEVQKDINLKEITNDVAPVSELSYLCLNNLPKLRCVWNKDLFGILSFQNLLKVKVQKCKSIKHLFPASMVLCLHQLEELFIDNCELLETIVYEKEDGMNAEVPRFLFPKLSSFWLKRLPKLASFYPWEHTTEWPVLKVLRVYDCEKVEIFSLDFLCLPEKRENQFEKLMSNLESLSIKSKDMMMIMRHDGHFSPELFHNIQKLTITEFHDKSATFPSKFLHRFPNLERFSVYECSFQEIFPYDGKGSLLEIKEIDRAEHTSLLAHLKDLKLYKLPKLKYIWKEDSPLIPILEKLESLQVWECPRLTNLVPLSISFKFLKKLFIWDCAGLINLIQPSTARSLVQLTELRITRCRMIQEIIVGEEDESEDEIVFSRLVSLELGDLPRLTKFCTGDYTFKFPLLQLVIVRQCPNMRTFCGGITSTPMLKGVYLTESKNEECWMGDLNTTMQQQFSAMESFHGPEELKLSGVPDFAEMSDKLSKMSYCNLTRLTIEKCDNLKYLFTPSIAMGLVGVQKLTIKSCVMMKEIVGKEKETIIDAIIFPRLSFLSLEYLPNLTRFCSGRSRFCQSAISDHMTMNQGVGEMESNENLDTALLPLFNEKVNFPSLKTLMINNLDNIKSVWHSELHEDSFCKLTSLTVRKCANLLNIFPSTMLNRIWSMEILHIVDCDALEEVFEVQKGLILEEITDNATSVLHLRELKLYNLPKLRRVWGNNLHEIPSFQNLNRLRVVKCQSLTHLFPASVAQCLHNLEILIIQDCKEVETVVVHDDENEELVEEIKAEVFTFMFPKLGTFVLKQLPKLECFYPREHTMEWPALKELGVDDCVQLCAMDFLSFPEKQGEKQVEKVCAYPKLYFFKDIYFN